MRYKNRRTTALMVTACLLSAGWLAMSVHAEEKQAKQAFYPALTEREEKLEAALRADTECEFPEIPLEEVITFFSELHNVPIVIQRTDLKDINLTVDEPIDVKLTDLSLKNALIQILDPIELTYVVDRDLILITSKDKAAQMLKPRVYPVGDLCRSGPDDYQILAEAIRNSNLGDWKWEELPSAPGGFGGGVGPQPRRVVNHAGGTISEVPESHSLVISQTYHAHNAIVELLTQLRQARAAQLKSPDPAL
ncbi:hypothetical protein Pan241w_06280 [Gimesia alba]|uniref:Uncharacterized protein n=1 Tax=Gimesia alba TaxID=2527973 RepID=A0A517R9N9_9PLAN|nr:hypothetical protein [Gimesia alba]QDT40571.1 hypothetical protein Pan241w_06280 [Gimesia alba]